MAKFGSNTKKTSKDQALLLLLCMTLLGVFPLDVILPSFPALSAHFQTPPSDISLSISIFAIGVAISQLFLGPLSDRIGRKGLLQAGLILSIVGAIGCTLTSNFMTFMFFRILQALGCGCFVLTHALVQDIFTHSDRDRIRVIMTSASGLFISTSPLIGVLLQETIGWTASFYFFSLIAVWLILQAHIVLAAEHSPPLGKTSFLICYSGIASNGKFLGFSLIAAIAFTCHFSFIAISPVIFLKYFQLSQIEFGFALLSYGAAYVAGGLIATRLQTAISQHAQITAGIALIGISGIALLLFTVWMPPHVATILISMIICTTGTTIARPVATSRAMEFFPQTSGAAASALNTIIFLVGGIGSAAVAAIESNFQILLGMAFIVSCGTGLAIIKYIHRGSPHSI